jgi:hypothetical protein
VTPSERATATGALGHPYFVGLHDEHDEPTADACYEDLVGGLHTTEDYRRNIWREAVEVQSACVSVSAAPTSASAPVALGTAGRPDSD